MGPQAEMEGAPPVLTALLMVSSKACGFPDCTKSQACQAAVTSQVTKQSAKHKKHLESN